MILSQDLDKPSKLIKHLIFNRADYLIKELKPFLFKIFGLDGHGFLTFLCISFTSTIKRVPISGLE